MKDLKTNFLYQSVLRLGKAEKKWQETGDLLLLAFIKRESGVLLRQAIKLWWRLRFSRQAIKAWWRLLTP